MTQRRRTVAEQRNIRAGEASSAKPEAVRVRMFGGFSVSVGSRTVGEDGWRLKKAASLVKLLALEPGHRMHRERAMNLLWPELDAKAAANNLHRVLHFARAALETTPTNSTSHYLSLQGDLLALCPDGILWVDVEAFESAAAIARRSREPTAHRAAAELYTGELLPEDRYEEWTQEKREELRQLYLRLLAELAELHEEREEYEPAIEALRPVISEEPTREEAHVDLMRLYAFSGQHYEAVLQYEQLRNALSQELDAEPSGASQRLYEEIRAGKFPATPSPVAGYPLKEAVGSVPNNLPIPLTSFIGREHEMLEARRLLSMTRLLTLTGAGGCGKTRLALEVAADLVGAYPDGVWLVELAPLSDPALVPQEMAATLGVREQPNRPLAQTLSGYLGSRQALLVLDNCEHLVDAAARLAKALLSACPKLRILATSREPLGVPGESVWPVPSLSLPDAEGAFTTESLMSCEAVRLFMDRARSRLPDFELTAENAGAVVRVCRKLDGIPLAIELASARVGALAVEQVAERLEDSLKLLTGGSRTAEPRQQTLRAALDWSYDLLDEAERMLFRQLSVFSGGWILEAAEEVCSGDRGGDVLDLLSLLVDKSLVVTGASTDGATRYRMMEPIRQYGREKLEKSGETQRVRESHAGYYLALAEVAEPELMGLRQGTWLDLLDVELDNLRAALSWSLEEADGEERAESGLRAAAALWRFWDMHGPGEGRAWLEAALERGQGGSYSVRAKALAGLGWIMLFQGDYELAVATLEEAIELYKDLGDLSGEAIALMLLGFAVAHAGDVERFPALSEQCEALLQKPLERRAAAYLLIFLGMVALEAGDYERAVALLEESRASFRVLGDLRDESMSSFTLGMTELKRGNLQRGTEVLEEGLSLARRTKDKLGSAYYFLGLGGVAAEQGQPIRAARLWGAAEALREVIGLPLSYFDLAHSGYEARLAAVRAQLDETAWEAAWSEGRAMSPEQAIEYALGTEEPALPAAPTLRKGPGRSTDALTRREREIAILVARELTNRRIAEELSISEHTVATHVRNILKKLGLRSRTQISA
jgi:predicted ATPase/DNA-binding SARP family transcriptional activator/DNA-binding CsgD family transcriptional regulator